MARRVWMPAVPSFFGLSATEARSGAGVKNVGIFQKKVLPHIMGRGARYPLLMGLWRKRLDDVERKSLRWKSFLI